MADGTCWSACGRVERTAVRQRCPRPPRNGTIPLQREVITHTRTHHTPQLSLAARAATSGQAPGPWDWGAGSWFHRSRRAPPCALPELPGGASEGPVGWTPGPGAPSSECINLSASPCEYTPSSSSLDRMWLRTRCPSPPRALPWQPCSEGTARGARARPELAVHCLGVSRRQPTPSPRARIPSLLLRPSAILIPN
jgi:hypothetical protein